MTDFYSGYFYVHKEYRISINDKGEILLPSGVRTIGYLDKNGYLYITPKVNGKNKNLKVHRLVAELFIPNPDNKPCVNHIDGDKQNNCVDNLEWCTHSENMKHAVKLGLCVNSSNTGESHNTSKHSDDEVKEIRKLYSTGNYTMRDLAKKFSTSSGYISDVVNNKIRIK